MSFKSFIFIMFLFFKLVIILIIFLLMNLVFTLMEIKHLLNVFWFILFLIFSAFLSSLHKIQGNHHIFIDSLIQFHNLNHILFFSYMHWPIFHYLDNSLIWSFFIHSINLAFCFHKNPCSHLILFKPYFI